MIRPRKSAVRRRFRGLFLLRTGCFGWSALPSRPGALSAHFPKLDSSFLKNVLSFSQKCTVIFPKMYCHFLKKTVHFLRCPSSCLRVEKWVSSLPTSFPIILSVLLSKRVLTRLQSSQDSFGILPWEDCHPSLTSFAYRHLRPLTPAPAPLKRT